jgi:hypothetical protein
LRPRATLGVDIGTCSTRGLPVDDQGTVIRPATREHAVDRPDPGRVEMAGRGAAFPAGPTRRPVAIKDGNPSVISRRPDPVLRTCQDEPYSPPPGALHRHDRVGARPAVREESLTRTTTEELR